MNIDIGTLKSALTEAYTKGTEGSLDLVSSCVEEILEKLNRSFKKSEGWKIYTVKELREKSVPTVFQHKTLGACFVEQQKGKEKELKFPDGKSYTFDCDDYPFNIPMKEIKDSDYE